MPKRNKIEALELKLMAVFSELEKTTPQEFHFSDYNRNNKLLRQYNRYNRQYRSYTGHNFNPFSREV